MIVVTFNAPVSSCRVSKPEQILYNSSHLVDGMTTEEDVGSEVIHLYEVSCANLIKIRP